MIDTGSTDTPTPAPQQLRREKPLLQSSTLQKRDLHPHDARKSEYSVGALCYEDFEV